MNKPPVVPYGPVWRIGAVVLFLIVSYFTISLALPFQPYKYLEFTSIPESACVNKGVQVEAEREIVDPAIGSIDRAEVASWWINSATGITEDAGSVPIPIAPTEREVINSPILREAPSEPGDYYLYTETTVYGYVGLVPRHSTIARTSAMTTEVMKCAGENES